MAFIRSQITLRDLIKTAKRCISFVSLITNYLRPDVLTNIHIMEFLSSDSAGAVQSSIACPCRNTRAAVATAAPSNTSSPSATTTTSGRGRPVAPSSR